MHNDWEDSRKQEIRQTAIEQSRKLHTSIMKQVNKTKQKEKEEDDPRPEITDEEVYKPSAEEVIEDAEKIYDYIKEGEKGL